VRGAAFAAPKDSAARRIAAVRVTRARRIIG